MAPKSAVVSPSIDNTLTPEPKLPAFVVVVPMPTLPVDSIANTAVANAVAARAGATHSAGRELVLVCWQLFVALGGALGVLTDEEQELPY